MGGIAAPLYDGRWRNISTPPPQQILRWTGQQTVSTQLTIQTIPGVKVEYRPAGGLNSATETITLDTIHLDLTKEVNETIVPGSARFRFGGSTYQHTAGALYRNPSPATGAGTQAGSIDAATGRVLLTQWTAGPNTVTLDALTTQIGGQPIGSAVFRTVASPIKPGALQIRWTLVSGDIISKVVGQSGIIEDADATILVDWARGVIAIRFGLWREDADLTPEEKEEPWYDPGSVVDIDGVDMIWQTKVVQADSLIYNAVATTMLPPDSNLLGIDAARLPPDGKALIYRVGMLALIHHTDSLAQAELLAGEVIDCGRLRLYRVVIEDANGLRLMPDLYTVNRELGTVTMADPLDLGAYEAPYTVKHTVADLQRVRDTDINGRLTFLRPVSHEYPADGDSYVSGMLYVGTLQGRYSKLFKQSTWTGVWSDALIGSAPLASFNDALYPIEVSNAGAYQDRILVRFTSASAFEVIGEALGLLGIGNINADCAPINPLTNQPYFTIPYQGWGGGWAAGNCLRFNLQAACYPVDCVRAVQPSEPTGLQDSVELLLVGNVDA